MFRYQLACNWITLSITLKIPGDKFHIIYDFFGINHWEVCTLTRSTHTYYRHLHLLSNYSPTRLSWIKMKV